MVTDRPRRTQSNFTAPSFQATDKIMASTGSAGKVVSGIEATDSESQSTTKPNETPRRQYLMKRLVDEDQFGAGFYGTYFSIFILVIGK